MARPGRKPKVLTVRCTNVPSIPVGVDAIARFLLAEDQNRSTLRLVHSPKSSRSR